MSSENAKAQECELADSVSVVEVELIEDVKHTKSVTTKINKEYWTLMKLVFSLVTDIVKDKKKIKPSIEHIKMLRETEMQLNKFHHMYNPQDASFDDVLALAQISLKLSEAYQSDDNRRDKLYIAKEHLMQCVQLLEGKELDREVIFTVVKAFYALGCISAKLNDLEDSEQFMHKVLELYLAYTENKNDYPVPIYFPTVIGIETERNYTYEMDILYARALQTLMMYQHYNISEYSLTDKCTMITYVHKILAKMLKTAPLSITYTEWATISSQLSLELLKYKRFNEARHYLAAASLFLKKFYEEEFMKIDGDKFPTDKTVAHNTYTMAAIDVAINWAKYGNTLLRSSGERLLHGEEKDESAMPSLELLFVDLENELQNFTDVIRDTYIMDYKDAKAIFRLVLKWLEEAKGLATKEKITSRHMDISRGIFYAYKYIARYERKKNDQIKLYQQLMDTLQDLSKSLSANDDDDIRKYISLQLVLVSYSLLEVKTEDLESYDKISAELSVEIEKLVKYNVFNSELYLYGIK